MMISVLMSAALISAGVVGDDSVKPEVTVAEANGYEVFFVNTHNGNRIAVTFNVQAGSLHDEPTKRAGMAHLWEHTIFLGSEAFPGKRAFEDIAERLGAKWNAYTASNRIFYHLVVHPRSVKETVELLGAMVSKPAMVEADFLTERDVVKNEARTYQERDGIALEASLLLNLLPKGDPWAMYDVGTQDQLNGLTLDHLKALFQANYRPGSAQVIISGNFDAQTKDQPLSRDEILKWVQASFRPPTYDTELAARYPEIRRGREIRFPRAIDSDLEGRRYMELSSSSGTRLLTMLYEAPSNLGAKGPFLLEMLCDYFNSKAAGSLYDFLKAKGWVNDIGMGRQEASNRVLLSLTLDLTEEGGKHRAEILSAVSAEAHRLAFEGIQPDVFEHLVKTNIFSYQKAVRKGFPAAELFAKSRDYDRAPDLVFNFSDVYGSLTAEEFKTAALTTLDPIHMIAGYLGPDVTSGESAPVFSERKISFPESSSIWKLADRAFRRGGFIARQRFGNSLGEGAASIFFKGRV